MGLRKRYKKRIKLKIEDYCNVNYNIVPKSEMLLGKGLFNNKCQWNAVQRVKDGKCQEVYLCVCISDTEFPIIHFINKKDDKYIDNTLGFKYEEYRYYIIRKIDESEYFKTNEILCDTKKMFLGLYSNSILNKLYSVDEHNLGI